ncbi:hypothetical protein [Polaromonas sp.]|uniref:hypothetical protein n=1 Tax=Polaromonas sp. TaxID=1869339 RepID=UPI001D7F11FE|nr:hypothetical protein [Polaromonas sp.]MBT9477422.1 hypothetical protein [Polaromonas sp.]
MFIKTEFFLRRTVRCLLASGALVVLAACSSPASHGADVNAHEAAAPIAPIAPDAGPGMLAYADRVRLMPPAALGAEVARLGEAMTPAAQLQLALALGQLRQLPELIRAQELLARVLGNPEAQPLHALARLLAARYGEQRRLEEQLEKQTQQVRELQRKLDQSNERLEALKAIERSLTSRPAAPLPPARRVRPGP